MASWIIVLTFIATLGYLVNANRNFAPLGLASSAATAMILCFFGLLFSAASSALLTLFDTTLTTELPQALLVCFGVLIGILIRRRWKKSFN